MEDRATKCAEPSHRDDETESERDITMDKQLLADETSGPVATYLEVVHHTDVSRWRFAPSVIHHRVSRGSWDAT